MDTTLKAPIAARINLRMILFAGIVLALVGVPVYTFVNESLTHGIHNRGAYKEVDLKAMGFFEINPVNATLKDVPEQYRMLDGQKVLLSGEIFSPFAAKGKISEFTLVYSIQKCCFNGPPKVQERVFATVAPDKTVEYAGDGYHDVVGTLHVTMKRDPKNQEVVEVYHLDVDSLKPSR
jgi:hypothetical protein